MIQTNSNKQSLKAIRDREAKEKEGQLKAQCEELANEKFGKDEVVRLSNLNRGLWFLPIINETDNVIEAMAIMKPIDRHILSYASTKIEDEGLYTFLEQCMRECFVASVEPSGEAVKDANASVIITDDEYFIPAAMKFNKIIESKKVAFLKR